MTVVKPRKPRSIAGCCHLASLVAWCQSHWPRAGTGSRVTGSSGHQVSDYERVGSGLGSKLCMNEQSRCCDPTRPGRTTDWFIVLVVGRFSSTARHEFVCDNEVVNPWLRVSTITSRLRINSRSSSWLSNTRVCEFSDCCTFRCIYSAIIGLLYVHAVTTHAYSNVIINQRRPKLYRKRSTIGPKLLLFAIIPVSMTLNDLERPQRTRQPACCLFWCHVTRRENWSLVTWPIMLSSDI